jgi:hypothetical protein
MTDLPPDGSPNLETLEECSQFQVFANDTIAALHEGFVQVASYAENLQATYGQIMGPGSVEAGKCATLDAVATEGARMCLRLSEMNQNLRSRIAALGTRG